MVPLEVPTVHRPTAYDGLFGDVVEFDVLFLSDGTLPFNIPDATFLRAEGCQYYDANYEDPIEISSPLLPWFSTNVTLLESASPVPDQQNLGKLLI